LSGLVSAIIPSIIEQHAEEAAFLWLLRDAAVDAPHYARRHLARLDERLEAHIDGLRVAGEAGIEIALEQLARNREPGELFAASVLGLERGDPIEPLVELAETEPEARRGLLGAIGWVAPSRLKATVRAWLGGAPVERFLGLVACSLHRADPHSRLAGYLGDPSPLVRARALRLAGELGRVDLARELVAALDDEECRFWAAFGAGLVGERAAIPVLEEAAERAPDGGRALEVVLRVMDRGAAQSWLRQLTGERRHARRVIRGLGILGDPAAVPWLIGRMADPELARLAGESFSLITGIDLALDDLEGDAPDGFEAGPSDDPAEESVALDPDEDLPWPEPELMGAWWEAHGSRFPAGTRHLLGRPIDEAACAYALDHGYQRQRRAAAYELACARPDAGLPSWRGRVHPRPADPGT
jgi:uncharacterized protein (TIGR02270 family)